MTHNEFCQYLITSTRGRLYGGQMLVNAVCRSTWVSGFLRGRGVSLRAVAKACVSDPDFMRKYRGQIPARVVDAIVARAVCSVFPISNRECNEYQS